MGDDVGSWDEAWWESEVSGRPRRDSRSGVYRRYVPDLLRDIPLVLDPETDARIAEAERRVRGLALASHDLAGISRFLLRSEAIASSRIEGIAPSARQVALAELGQRESIPGISEQAQLVANNMTIVRDATTRLVEVDRVSVEHIVTLHRSLLPDEVRHHGIRGVQNWIGGSDWHPLDAEFVPPAADRLDDLMDDLMAFMAGGLYSPIIQAALVHAQFEAIHPFTDGNGRVGRALIHTVLARRGVVGDALLPISLVFSTLRERYVSGLTVFRSDQPAMAPGAKAARAAWVAAFADSTVLACDQAERIAEELVEVRSSWAERLEAHRVARGARRALRSDSAASAILADLPATPVLTTATVTSIHGVSHVAAGRALDELTAAGVLEPKAIGHARRAYIAGDVLELIT